MYGCWLSSHLYLALSSTTKTLLSSGTDLFLFPRMYSSPPDLTKIENRFGKALFLGPDFCVATDPAVVLLVVVLVNVNPSPAVVDV